MFLFQIFYGIGSQLETLHLNYKCMHNYCLLTQAPIDTELLHLMFPKVNSDASQYLQALQTIFQISFPPSHFYIDTKKGVN